MLEGEKKKTPENTVLHTMMLLLPQAAKSTTNGFRFLGTAHFTPAKVVGSGQCAIQMCNTTCQFGRMRRNHFFITVASPFLSGGAIATC